MQPAKIVFELLLACEAEGELEGRLKLSSPHRQAIRSNAENGESWPQDREESNPVTRTTGPQAPSIFPVNRHPDRCVWEAHNESNQRHSEVPRIERVHLIALAQRHPIRAPLV
jgi:hypothetical protein